MESSILKQITRFLQEQKKHKRWAVVFVCLAVIVGFGTVTALKMMGQAMTHKERRLVCQLQVHQHEEGCYDAEQNVVCGYADYVVHKHNDDCYMEDGTLACALPELEVHEHTEECWSEEQTVVCGLEESIGHEHTEECYTQQTGEIQCGLEEHQHTEECSDEEGNLVCVLEEHQHAEECYPVESVLTCTVPEGEGAHTHAETCYEVQKTLVCEKPEVRLHTHADECYEIIDPEQEYSEENRRLICEQLQVEEHVHTEDGGCLEIIEVTAVGEPVEDTPVEEQEIFTTDLDGENAEDQTEDENDAENTEDADEESENTEDVDAKDEKTYELTKTYTGDGYTVTAEYNEDANIPEEAELIAEQITVDSDEEHYSKREAEYRKSTGDKNAVMKALFKVGFYVDGEEVEPETAVKLTIQLFDENGLPEGTPITVVHFAEKGTEVLDGSEAESGSTSFEMESFSDVAIGFRRADVKKTSVHISESTTYEDEIFKAVFRIEGEVELDGETDMESADEGKDNDESLDTGRVEEEESFSDEGVTTEGEETSPEGDTELDGEADGVVADGAGTATDGESGAGDAVESESTESNESSNNGLKFEVETEFLNKNSDKYAAIARYIGKTSEIEEMLKLQMLSCTLLYNGEEVDISNCKVTAKITAAKSLADEAQESVPEAVKQLADNEEGIAPISEEEAERKTEILVTAMKVKGTQVSTLGDLSVNENGIGEPIECEFDAFDEEIALYAESSTNPLFTVQYYAYAQIMEDTQPTNPDGTAQTGVEAIRIIDTSREGGTAVLPEKGYITKNMYVGYTGKDNNYPDAPDGLVSWEIYKPLYKSRELSDNGEMPTDSLTKLYTANKYEFREVASGLDHIDKFAKEGMNFELYEVWVLENAGKVDSTSKDGWKVYKQADIPSLQFTNNKTEVKPGTILITDDTVIRLVGKSNTEEKDYPTRFFDYDITDGHMTKDEIEIYKTNMREGGNQQGYFKGINDKTNFENSSEPRYGFGNNNNGVGLANDMLAGKYINKANTSDPKTILGKCSYGLVEHSLSKEGLPVIKANAPDLFSPTKADAVSTKQVLGKTEISGRSLKFGRDGDTYTLQSVVGSEASAQDLNLFQKGTKAYGTEDLIWTNQFWPMDNAETFGDTANGHDPKFGTKTQEESTGLIRSDDGKEHNNFFGMTFEVDFKLTDDYVGPLNYYFFGDDDMWVFLEYPDGSTQLICDIGGVHQAAGEYVDLWNYIQKPEDGAVTVNPDQEEERPTQSYRLKFFYTERGASGSTCWMQFTLPSVNAVPVIDYTGNVKSTLTMGKKVEGADPKELFDFTIEFTGKSDNIKINNYPYEVKDKDGKVIRKGEVKSGGIFKLGNEETIVVYNLPDETEYSIKEVDNGSYQPGLGTTSTGVILKDETVEGNIDWDRDDHFEFINKPVKYELPETGGSGPIIYTMAGVLVIIFGAGFMYRKKVRERRV